MMKLKSHSINNIPPETLDLLHSACRRSAKKYGVPVTFQAFLRKLLQEAADAEKALQDAAAQEYAKQASEDAGS